MAAARLGHEEAARGRMDAVGYDQDVVGESLAGSERHLPSRACK